VIEQTFTAGAVSVKPPEIHGAGVEPAQIRVSLQMELTSAEARELAEVLRLAADTRDEMDAAIIPHLQRAFEERERIETAER
jgi:hypothetical protein